MSPISPVAKPASVAGQAPLPESTASPEPDATAAAEATPTFRVGDYEVGDGYFSELNGHPDIIY